MGMLSELALRRARAQYDRQLDNLAIDPETGEPLLDVWHGGAPNIERFDMGMMGTGEGAQMYSDGLYFGQRRGTGKKYRDDWTDRSKYQNQTNGTAIVGNARLPINGSTWLRINNTDSKDYKKTMMAQAQDVIDNPEKDDWPLRLLARHITSPMEGRQKWAATKKYEITPENYYMAKAEQEAESWGEIWDMDEIDPPDTKQFTLSLVGERGDQLLADFDNGVLRYNDLGRDIERQYDPDVDAEWIYFDLKNSHTAELVDWQMWELTDAPELDDLAKKYQLAIEVEPNKFEWIDPLDPEQNYRIGTNRRMTRDGKIIREGSPDYYHHLYEYLDKADSVAEDIVNNVSMEIVVNKNLPKWDTSRIAEPQLEKGGLYKAQLRVNPDKLLDWFEPIGTQPAQVKELTASFLEKVKNDYGGGGGFGSEIIQEYIDTLPEMTGQDFTKAMVNLLGREQYRKQANAHGMPGIIYRDWTRDYANKNPTYNFVMYDDKVIDILERGAATAPFLGAVFGITAGTIAAASSLNPDPSFLNQPILDSDIAKQFPLPEDPDNQPSFFDDLMNNEMVRGAMANPIVQHVGKNLSDVMDATGMLGRGTAATADVMYEFMNRPRDTKLNLEYAKDLGSQWWKRFNTPYDQTMDKASEYVLKQTGSPALATGAYMGMFAGDLSNWVGP